MLRCVRGGLIVLKGCGDSKCSLDVLISCVDSRIKYHVLIGRVS